MGEIPPAFVTRTQSEDAHRGWWNAWPLFLSVTTLGCAASIPPDFVPDPGLVDRITEIRIEVAGEGACPGTDLSASYAAILSDGTALPFATRYDEDNPPTLHVSFLERSSMEAEPKSNGGWEAGVDPLASLMDGFRLRAVMKADPSLAATARVEPRYDCLPHVFEFVGASGRTGRTGRPGPDVIVRADVVSSPFYERLFVASIQVGDAPPRYVLADFEVIPPSDWLVIASRGGRGGRGVGGTAGEHGANGNDGCPAGNGGAGGAGGNGGPGGAGGSGGHISVFVPDDQPLLAGLIETHADGGEGGKGGAPGAGGPGGEGGKGVTSNRRVTCEDGISGPSGPDGSEGPGGARGAAGPRPQIVTVPADRVFGARPHPVIQELIDYNSDRRRDSTPRNGSQK